MFEPDRSLEALTSALRVLDLRLQPIAKRSVDMLEPNWIVNHTISRALDEAGIRDETQTLLLKFIALYDRAPENIRDQIRARFETFSAFAWAASLAAPPLTRAAARKHLLHFSIVDSGPDSRDAILQLQYICHCAVTAGVDMAPLLAEIAELSSDKDKHGMGSTRNLLRRAESSVAAIRILHR